VKTQIPEGKQFPSLRCCLNLLSDLFPFACSWDQFVLTLGVRCFLESEQVLTSPGTSGCLIVLWSFNISKNWKLFRAEFKWTKSEPKNLHKI